MYDYNFACGFLAIAPAPIALSKLEVTIMPGILFKYF